jgi:hypothetical protein
MRLITRFVLVFLLGSTGTVWADGDCGGHVATEAEKQFSVATLTALKALVPPAPAGWRIDDRLNEIIAPKSFCERADEPVQLGYYRVGYTNTEGRKQLDIKTGELAKQINALRRPTPQEQQALNEAEGGARTLLRNAKAIAATDKAGADKMTAEAQVLGQRGNAIRQAILTKPEIKALEAQIEALEKEAVLSAELNIRVNLRAVDSRRLTPGAAMAGSGITLTSPTETFLAWGPWKPGSGFFEAKAPRGKSAMVYSVAIQVTGTPKAAEAVLAGLNGPAVATLLK